ncbi:hypothetical protein CDD82_5598 [Ophiocordyceps australis]|uniref:Meiotic expression up-regulated protein 6 PH domain-containing protein n=1 Tax=Ophiocordyceps australis TaxID=1399860 RepID=A0A2C5Z041_9HYPO|nr:hypothetical protein CDD82_5598 [Ophiocordyceps australis]
MAEPQKPSVELPDVSKPESAVAASTTAAPSSDPTPEITPAPPVETTKPDADAEASAIGAAAKEDKDTSSAHAGEGYLGHKAQGASFPKNLIPSKEFFFFGIESFEPKALQNYLKSAKSSETAHHNIAWASNTGKGLLFVGDKKNPTGIINLADASEPEIDGPNKFHLTSKGNKHSFKAASVAERDGWVSQLKHQISEAKKLAAIVTESETYKQALASLKPAPIVPKEDKAVNEPAKDEEPAKTEEAPKEGEAAKEEPKEDPKAEEPKRRSASRKRTSFFAFVKKEEKKEEHKPEEAAPEAAETSAAAENTPDVETTAAVPAATPTAAPASEDKPAEEAAPAESPKEKHIPAKRNSFFGGVFSKKEKKATDVAKSVEQTPEVPNESDAPVSDATAPVIPPVESTTPLAVDVSNPVTVPTENVDAAATGEAKKDVKEKRKSSLPFAFGKREKSPVPADGEDKSGKSAFSKLRATIKGKTAPKTDDKVAEEVAKDEAVATESAKEAPAPEGAAKEAEAAPAAEATEPESENKPENVGSPAPVVTAAA